MTPSPLPSLAPLALRHSQQLASCHMDFERREARVLLWDMTPGGENWVDGKLVGPCHQINGLRAKVEAVAFSSPEECGGARGLIIACCMADGVVKVSRGDIIGWILAGRGGEGDEAWGKGLKREGLANCEGEGLPAGRRGRRFHPCNGHTSSGDGRRQALPHL